MRKHCIIMSILALAGIFAMPVKAEINYLRLYLVGEATPAGWNENLPEELVAIGNDCFLWDGWLTTGEFKFLNTLGDWDSSIVTSTPGLVFESGVKYDLYYRNGTDNKFVNNTPGYVRIVVDLRNMKVNFRRPALAFTGPAALGWSLEEIIPVFADDEGRASWSGQLRSGELKILTDGATDWHPCYNALFEGDILSAGGHGMIFNATERDGEGNYVDFKYVVPCDGYYTMTFKNDNGGRFYGVDVEISQEPDLTGGFRSRPGRYLAAVDRAARRVHLGPLPSRLYIGVSGEDCAEIMPSGENTFSSVVSLKMGGDYKLASDPSAWDMSSISPNSDTDISTGATTNLAPMHGYSYVVHEDGNYRVTADFSGSVATLQAHKESVSAAEMPLARAGVSVSSRGGELSVEGDYTSVAVYDVSGRLVGDASPCRITAGTYIVKVDNNVYKIISR